MFARVPRTATILGLLIGAPAAFPANLSSGILRQLPSGYVVLTSARSTVGARTFDLVALRSRKELPSENYIASADDAPDRPLLIFERRPNGSYLLVGRNDKVIATADAAGAAVNGCDPFEDGGITVKGPYFTIENRVSCGAHWTDYVTFRFDPRARAYVFDNERFQSWKLNPSSDSNADALIRNVRRVWHSPKNRLVTFSSWRPPTS